MLPAGGSETTIDALPIGDNMFIKLTRIPEDKVELINIMLIQRLRALNGVNTLVTFSNGETSNYRETLTEASHRLNLIVGGQDAPDA